MEGQPEPFKVSEEVFIVKFTGCITLLPGKIPVILSADINLYICLWQYLQIRFSYPTRCSV